MTIKEMNKMNKEEEIIMYKEIAIFREKQAMKLEKRLKRAIKYLENKKTKDLDVTLYNILMGKDED